MRSVVLYGRDGCCLCDDAREIVEAVRLRVPFELSECDIEGDEALHSAYLERIPVITIDGVERFELIISEDEFERAVLDPGPAVECSTK